MLVIGRSRPFPLTIIPLVTWLMICSFEEDSGVLRVVLLVVVERALDAFDAF